MAKKEMRKLGYSEEMISEATSYGDTTDEEILAARAKYKELYDKFKAEIAPEHDEVKALGGLYIIGTERHESRRIDNQLRGRAGRQGDPGTTKFYIAMEDDIMRLFGSDRYIGMVERMGFADDMPLEAKMLSGAIETAQKRVEGMNFDRRENVLKYDDVMNTQRELIYKQRRQVIDGTDITENIKGMIESYVLDMVDRYTSGGEFVDDWDLKGLIKEAEKAFLPEGEIRYTKDDMQNLEKADLIEDFTNKAFEFYEKKEAEYGTDAIRELERIIMLRVVDTRWMDHIDEMDQLKQGIWLRSYGQKDPAMEYKAVGSDMFDEMIENIKIDVGRYVLTSRINTKRVEVAKPVSESREEEIGVKKKVTAQAKSEKVGRNDPCPCGSGLKYKKCCGK